jgi:hypothetical protein
MVPMPEEAVRAQLKTVTNKSEPDWPNGVLGTAGVATGRSTGRGFAPAPDLTPDGPGDAVPGGEKKGPKLNVALIKAWMDEEGWMNESLAQQLKISERAISSMRNNGEYHGAEAVAKLANLMARDIVDLYLP